MTNYVVTVHLLPQDATPIEWCYVFVNMAYQTKSTMLQSADDAVRLVTGGQPGSKVIVWTPDRWTHGNIVQWLADRGCSSETHMLPDLTYYYAYEIMPVTAAYIWDRVKGWMDGPALQ